MISKIEKVNKTICDKLTRLNFSSYLSLLNLEGGGGEEELTKKEIKDISFVYKNIKNYCKKLKSNNYEYEVIYDFAKGRKDGRLFAQGYGIQKIKKEFRGCLIENIYYDFDLVNAHYSILLKLCENHNINCSSVRDYVLKKNEIINRFSNDNEIEIKNCKDIFLSVLNRDYKVNKIGRKKIKGEFYFNLIDEILIIQETFKQLYKEDFKEVKKQFNKNIGGHFLNRVITKEEGRILNEVDKKFNCDVLMFDGFNKKIEDVKDSEQFINELNEFTNYKWALKDHPSEIKNNLLDLTFENKDTREFIEDNLKEVAFKIYEVIYKDLLFKCENLLYLHDLTWINKEKAINQSIINFLSTQCLIYIQPSPTVLPKEVCKLKDYKEITEFIINRAETNNNLLNNIFDDSLKKIYFNNGFYDITKNEFIKSKKLNTFKKINLDYDFKEYKEEQKYLYNKLFKPIFTIRKKREDYKIRYELYNNFLFHLSRALFGCIEDKNWLSFEGLRDCGKGVISDLIKKTFGEYIGITNGEVFLSSKNIKNDIAKSNSYLIDFEFTRLIISNEIEINNDTTIDGNKIKKLISGGDYLQARKNFQDEKEFRVQSSLLICCNDMPDINPADCKERQKQYYFKSKFVEKSYPENKKIKNVEYFLKDGEIKRSFNNERLQKAFFNMLVKAFFNPVKYPEELKEELKEETEDDFEKFYNLFDFESTETLLLKDVKKATKENNILFNNKKIKLLLLSKGIEYSRTSEGMTFKNISILGNDSGYGE